MTLEARHLSFGIGATSLIKEVSLAIQAGELVAVVGANGAGKTTLLRLLAGELTPTHGAVLLDGRPIAQWTKRDLARRRAILPQSSALAFGFSALEVVLMGRTPHLRGLERPEDYDIAYEALDATQARHLAQRSYITLSGGEKQRVQLARVLAQIWQATETRYLLLDEPTNNLDLAHQHGTLDIAVHFARRGVGVLAILHDLNLAAQYADRILILKAGQVLAMGAPTDVMTPDMVYNAFNMSVMVESHPCLNCPLVIPLPQQHFIKELES